VKAFAIAGCRDAAAFLHWPLYCRDSSERSFLGFGIRQENGLSTVGRRFALGFPGPRPLATARRPGRPLDLDQKIAFARVNHQQVDLVDAGRSSPTNIKVGPSTLGSSRELFTQRTSNVSRSHGKLDSLEGLFCESLSNTGIREARRLPGHHLIPSECGRLSRRESSDVAGVSFCSRG